MHVETDNFDFSDAPNDFVDIQFYADSDSILRDSTYCFDSVESMEIFKKNGNKLDSFNSLKQTSDGQFRGLPLFECRLKTDKSYILNNSQKNLEIYKFIVVPGDNVHSKEIFEEKYLNNRIFEFVCHNHHHNISIYKIEFSSIRNEGKFLKSKKTRTYTMKFRDDSLKMTLEGDNRNEQVVSLQHKLFDNHSWVLDNERGDVFKHGYFIKDIYSLFAQNGSVICQLDSTRRSNAKKEFRDNQYMGTLMLSNFDLYNPYDSNEKYLHKYHQNEFLSGINEKLIAMAYVLISQNRYTSNNRKITY
ncbi:hypothetical protein QEN19_002301 [Hanseniaspora menglaensis]